MVLKKLFIAICLITTLSSLAQVRVSASDRRLFSQAKSAYKSGQYAQVISILNRRYNLKDPKTPGGALALAAYSYEKMGQWKNAEKIYAYLITQRYKGANHQMIGAYRSGNVEDAPEIPNKLYAYYHRRAESLTQLYVRDYYTLNDRLRGLYKKTALMYVAILEESDYEDDSYDTIPERLEKFATEVKSKEYRSSWFVQSSYVSWRDKITIIFPDGTKANIDATGEGSCLGGGWRYENDYWEVNFNGCYAVASMTAGKENANISYFQKGVPSTAIIGGPSFLWKPKSKGAAFGVQLPFVYRSGAYESTPGATLEETTIFTYGYLLQADWRFEKWGIFTKFGKIQRFSSSLWSLGAMYSF